MRGKERGLQTQTKETERREKVRDMERGRTGERGGHGDEGCRGTTGGKRGEGRGRRLRDPGPVGHIVVYARVGGVRSPRPEGVPAAPVVGPPDAPLSTGRPHPRTPTPEVVLVGVWGV